MGRLFDKIRAAVSGGNYIVSWHADERCEEREISAWQIVDGIAEAHLVRERPRSKPNPSIVVQQLLVDGSTVEVIWSWLGESGRAVLVTVYFEEH